MDIILLFACSLTSLARSLARYLRSAQPFLYTICSVNKPSSKFIVVFLNGIIDVLECADRVCSVFVKICNFCMAAFERQHLHLIWIYYATAFRFRPHLQKHFQILFHFVAFLFLYFEIFGEGTIQLFSKPHFNVEIFRLRTHSHIYKIYNSYIMNFSTEKNCTQCFNNNMTLVRLYIYIYTYMISYQFLGEIALRWWCGTMAETVTPSAYIYIYKWLYI